MRNSNALRSTPCLSAAKPQAAIRIAAPVDGNALRTGAVIDDIGLEALFRTLEGSHFERMCLLRRGDATLVSAQRSDVVNGREGAWKLMRLSDDLFVRLSNTAGGQSAEFPISGEGLIEFHFRLSGRLSLSDAAGPGVEVDRGSLLIWRQPVGWNVTGRLDTDERETSVTIYLRPSVLENYFGDFAQSLPQDLTQRLCCEGGGLFALRLIPVPRLVQLVHELSMLDVSGPRRLVQAEALVMLILCEVVGMLEETSRDTVSAGRMTDLDVRCLRRARAILQERHIAPPTIEALAREVGLGTTKLKNGFKGLFGQTVCQFANEIRMERAREMLCKPDIPIGEVAEVLGYEYQNSFTAAFRRHFGVLPKDYRRDPLILGPEAFSGRPQ